VDPPLRGNLEQVLILSSALAAAGGGENCPEKGAHSHQLSAQEEPSTKGEGLGKEDKKVFLGNSSAQSVVGNRESSQKEHRLNGAGIMEKKSSGANKSGFDSICAEGSAR